MMIERLWHDSMYTVYDSMIVTMMIIIVDYDCVHSTVSTVWLHDDDYDSVM